MTRPEGAPSLEDFAVDNLVDAGTGHRPSKLGSYDEATFQKLCQLAKSALEKCKPIKVISGMALGWDVALAEVTLMLGIELEAAIPFKGQERKWPQKSQDRYHEILKQAQVTDTDPDKDGVYKPWKMQVRNKYMVDQCGLLLALWDGESGGTGNCVKYATSKDVPIMNLWLVHHILH